MKGMGYLSLDGVTVLVMPLAKLPVAARSSTVPSSFGVLDSSLVSNKVVGYTSLVRSNCCHTTPCFAFTVEAEDALESLYLNYWLLPPWLRF